MNLIVFLLVLLFAFDAYAAPKRVQLPEIAGNGIDDDLDGVVDEAVATSITEDPDAAGQYHFHFKDCGKIGFENVADDSFFDAFRVEMSAGFTFYNAQILCYAPVLAAGTYKLHLNYSSPSAARGVWFQAGTPMVTPVHTQGTILAQRASPGWQQIVLTGSNQNFADGLNGGSPLEFVHAGGPFLLWIKAQTASIRFGGGYLTTLADPVRVFPGETPDPPDPIADLEIFELGAATIPTAWNSAAFANANIMPFTGTVTGSPCVGTVKPLWDDAATDRLYLSISCADTQAVTSTTTNDAAGLLSAVEDRIDVRWRRDLSQVCDAETRIVAANLHPAYYDGNCSGGTFTSTANNNTTVVRNIVASTSWNIFIATDLGATTADALGIFQFGIVDSDPGAGAAVIRFKGNSHNNLAQWGTVKYSSTTVPESGDVTAPTVTNPAIVPDTVGLTSVVITGATDEDGTCRVHYGTATGEYTLQSAGSASVNNLCAESVLGLNANETYFYQLRVTDAAGNTGVATEVSGAISSVPVYYVGKQGSDANSCATAQSATAGDRKLTVAAGIGCLAAGNILIVGDGTYVEGINDTIPAGASTSARTTVRAENNRLAIIRPSTGVGPSNLHAVYLAKSNTAIDGLKIDGSASTSLTLPFRLNGTIAGNLLVNAEVMDVTGTNQGNCVTVQGTVTNSTIKDNIIHDCGDNASSLPHGVYIRNSGHIIEGNEIYDIGGGHGIHVFASTAGTNNNNIIRDNYVHNTGRTGIGIYAGNDNQVYRNRIVDFGEAASAHGIRIGTGSSVSADRTKIWNNTIYSGTGDCVEVDGSAQDNTEIRNNLCLSNSVNVITNTGTGTVSTNNTLSTNTALVVNAAGGDFTPAVGSTLIDSCVDVGLSFLGSAPDCGAVESVPGAPGASTHFAASSVQGTGSCLSSANACLIATAIGLLGPGNILELADGTYTGANSMLVSTTARSGTAENPITVRALNDGAVRLNGENARRPVDIVGNHWTLQGFNAHNSSDSVWNLRGNNLIAQRVGGWNAGMAASPGTTMHIFRVTGSNTLVEDCFGFGRARKILDNQGSSGTTWRRCWGIFEERNTNVTGPTTFTTQVYNSQNTLYENVIGTFDRIDGQAAHQAESIFSADGISNPEAAGLRVKGSIAYLLCSSNGVGTFSLAHPSTAEYIHNVSFIEPGCHTSTPGFELSFDGAAASPVLTIDDSVSIGGDTDTISADWDDTDVRSNVVDAATADVFNTVPGVCTRYENGTLGATKLWPWPMASRINAGLVLAGKNPDNYFGAGQDLTDLMEDLLGTIPAGCTS